MPFIEFAESVLCTLETRRSVHKLRDHMNLLNRLLTVLCGRTMPTIHAKLYSGPSHFPVVASNRPGCGATRILSGGIGRDNLTRQSDYTIVTDESFAMRMARHSAIHGVKAVRAQTRRSTRRSTAPWSYLRSGDKTPNRDVSRGGGLPLYTIAWELVMVLIF